jgi:hypothetical protein
VIVVLAAAIVQAAIGGPVQFTPSIDEAVERGVIYEMTAFPQQFGYIGFGTGFADLDGDGDPDIIVMGAGTGTTAARIGIFENDGTGCFTDRSVGNGIPLIEDPSGFAAGDIDGDGLPELYFTQLRLANVLVHNDGNFMFTDISVNAGVDDDGPGMGACFGDFDGDTRLDLYLCNYNGALPDTEDMDNKLYRNLGGGLFEDVSVAQTVDDFGYGFQAVWFDFDVDGDLDLYLSNDRGHNPPLFRTNQLWRNDDGQLVNISVGSGADLGLFSMGIACGDFNSNGRPDLYVTNVASYEDGFNPLFLNMGGDPPFVESSVIAGVEHWITSWGSIFYDFDNNGAKDLFVNNMFEANSLYVSSGSFPCVEAAAAAGIVGNAGESFSSAVADVDMDGDLDLLVNDLGFNVQLFINYEGQKRQWVRFTMAGLGDNVLAVGGKVITQVGARLQFHEILAGGNGYLGQNELTIHVGLDDALVVDQADVTWPGGSPARTLTNVPSGETWTLYPPSRLGDADADGTVNLDDYFVFAGCFDGGFQPGCEMMDFDGNSSIDLIDFDGFIAVYADPVYDCNLNQQDDLLEILLDPGLDADGTGVPDSCEAAGDLDGNGQVGITDFLMLLAAWGVCSDPGVCPADLDNDGSVGISDFLTLLGNWG